MEDIYDVVVIGAGPGGYVSAIHAAKLGLKTALVEEKEVGGTCLNRGCIPTKAFLHTAEQMNQIRKGKGFGIIVEDPKVDKGQMYAYKNDVVERLKNGILQLLKSNQIELIKGTAKIVDRHQVEVRLSDKSSVTLTAENILAATGSEPVRPKIKGIDLDGVVTSEELLGEEPQDFDSIVIIGGGVIGIEFAEIYAGLGCQVTILESMGSLLSSMDKDISQNLLALMKRKGIKVVLNATVTEIVQEEQLTVTYEFKDKLQEAVAERVLVAVGRRPRIKELFSDSLSIQMQGARLLTNENMQTNLDSVFAAGDVTSPIQLAHAASAQGIHAVETIAGVIPQKDLTMVPSCVYTNPEIASVGITAKEAEEKGIAVHVIKHLMHGNCRSVISKADRSFVKLIVEQETDRLLGAQLMCERATDMIGELALTIRNKMTIDQLNNVMRAHPTFYEAVGEAVEAFDIA